MEDFLLGFRPIAATCGSAGAAFAAELLLREAISNAVQYGSGIDARRRVRCSLRISARRFLAVIRDEGTGFDWRAEFDRQAGQGAHAARGLSILRAQATRIRYNQAGNMVSILKRFDQKPVKG